MFRQVRVIMSLVHGDMISGLQRIRAAFADLDHITNFLRNSFEFLSQAARFLWDQFIEGALADERLARQFSILTGSAEVGAQTLEMVEQWAIQAGVAMDDATQAAQILAPAIKAADGQLDPNRLIDYMETLEGLSLATGKSVPELAQAFQRAITGDVELLARALGISKEALAELSPEFARFMQQAQGAQGAQLGAVTRIAEGIAGGAPVDALKVMQELSAAMGVSAQDIEDWENSAEANITRFNNLIGEMQDRIGDEIKIALLPLLEEVNQFLLDNPELIQQFIDSISDFAADQFVALAEALRNVDWREVAQSGQTFADALKNIDWENVTRAINAMAALIGGDTNRFLEEAGLPQGSVSQPTTLPPVSQFLQNLGLPIGGGAQNGPTEPQNVNVTVTVDDEGNLKVKSISQQAASNAVENLVNSIVRTNNQRGR